MLDDIAQYQLHYVLACSRCSCKHTYLTIKMMTKDKERVFILECIQLYRDLPALWKIKSKEYTDRRAKSYAYFVLLTKYREMYPNAEREDVKKKFNSLRTNFRKELKKVLDSKKYGWDEAYKPTLWYFEEMRFLLDQESSEYSTLLAEDELADSDHLSIQEQIIKNGDPADITIRKRRITESPNVDDEVEPTPYYRQNDTPEEIDILAKSWASEYNKLRADQQIYAKKAINDILFEARFGYLKRNSIQINEGISSSSRSSTSYDKSEMISQSSANVSQIITFGNEYVVKEEYDSDN